MIVGARMPAIDSKLSALGIDLPTPVAPIANYVPFVQAGALVHISGQVSLDASGGIKGVVGVDVDAEILRRPRCGGLLRSVCGLGRDRCARKTGSRSD